MLKTLGLVVVLAPLAGAILAGLFGKSLGRANSHRVTILGVLISFALSVLLFLEVLKGNTFNGAVYTWAGNKDVGEGRMTIIESRPGELVRFKLEFLKPFEATNTAELSFKAAGSQTEVTWSMDGKCNFMMKAFGLFMDFDKMTGTDFEKGLANLKSVVTTAGK